MTVEHFANSRDFYELMQLYRHAPMDKPAAVVDAFEAVKDFIKARTGSPPPVILPNPEDDLFSDAMDAATSVYHSTRWGINKNAEKAGEQVNGERMVRRCIAAAFNAYVEEIRHVTALSAPSQPAATPGEPKCDCCKDFAPDIFPFCTCNCHRTPATKLDEPAP
jgi:hypothetical protein